MTSITTLQCRAALSFHDFPFKHELTDVCVWALNYEIYDALTGFCSGDVIDQDASQTVFFRAGFDPISIRYVESEYVNLARLRGYDFVPKVLCMKDFGRYKILFTEVLDAVSLDSLDADDPRLKDGLKRGLRLAHQLYSEIGFFHGDLHTGNIMIDPKDKIYLIDFAGSTITPTPWMPDLLRLIRTCALESTALDELALSLESVKNSTNAILYIEYVWKFERILNKLWDSH